MLFSQLCDQSEWFHPSLIFASGLHQVAVLRLLYLPDRLCNYAYYWSI